MGLRPGCHEPTGAPRGFFLVNTSLLAWALLDGRDEAEAEDGEQPGQQRASEHQSPCR